jgi:hypothetical protein
MHAMIFGLLHLLPCRFLADIRGTYVHPIRYTHQTSIKYSRTHTGNCLDPANLSNNYVSVNMASLTGPIYGPRKTGPMKGNCLRNPNTTGKKSPNKLMNPNTSTIIPRTGHFMKIRTTPPRKHIVPRNLCFRVKKWYVFVGPIINVNPDMNRSYISGITIQCTFPIANKAPSKNNMTPYVRTVNGDE